MCTTLTVIAYHNQCRMIARCEHGTIHLTWDISTLRLREPDFRTLAHFLQQHAMSERPSVNMAWCTLDRDARSNRRLWLGQVGLIMNASDFASLIDLVAEANQLLANELPNRSTSLLAHPLLKVDTDLIALN